MMDLTSIKKEIDGLHNIERKELMNYLLARESDEIGSTLNTTKLTSVDVDQLIQNNPQLSKQSQDQLNIIKKYLDTHSHGKNYGAIASGKLAVVDNSVCIGGYKTDIHKSIGRKNIKLNSNYRYPDFAKALLVFTSQLIGVNFYFPKDWDNLQEYKIDGNKFLDEINTKENVYVIKTLKEIVGPRVIPSGLDKEEFGIYLDLVDGKFVRSNYGGYYGNDKCLVPN